jgi:hypothetical protein
MIAGFLSLLGDEIAAEKHRVGQMAPNASR